MKVMEMEMMKVATKVVMKVLEVMKVMVKVMEVMGMEVMKGVIKVVVLEVMMIEVMEVMVELTMVEVMVVVVEIFLRITPRTALRWLFILTLKDQISALRRWALISFVLSRHFRTTGKIPLTMNTILLHDR